MLFDIYIPCLILNMVNRLMLDSLGVGGSAIVTATLVPAGIQQAGLSVVNFVFEVSWICSLYWIR